jgi:hypothetical protein
VELRVSASNLRVLDAELFDGPRAKIKRRCGVLKDKEDYVDIGLARLGERFVEPPLKRIGLGLQKR